MSKLNWDFRSTTHNLKGSMSHATLRPTLKSIVHRATPSPHAAREPTCKRCQIHLQNRSHRPFLTLQHCRAALPAPSPPRTLLPAPEGFPHRMGPDAPAGSGRACGPGTPVRPPSPLARDTCCSSSRRLLWGRHPLPADTFPALLTALGTQASARLPGPCLVPHRVPGAWHRSEQILTQRYLLNR